MNELIREKLLAMGENKYMIFTSSLIPGANNIIGIRLPRLREYAKELAKSGNVPDIQSEDLYFEETMIKGMIIGYLKIPTDQRTELIREFIPLINNWSICDSFICTMKFPKKDLPAVWDFISSYFDSDKEFEQRFAAVMILRFFVNDEYIQRSLKALKAIDTQAYYSSMGVAWTAAECYIKYPSETLPCFTDKCFDAQTHNKAISKICDSYRVSKTDKEYLKTLRL